MKGNKKEKKEKKEKKRDKYGGGLLQSTYSGPQDRPASNGEGSRTTAPIKNINLLKDRLEAREQDNRSRFKKYEVLIELSGFENRQLFGQYHPPQNVAVVRLNESPTITQSQHILSGRRFVILFRKGGYSILTPITYLVWALCHVDPAARTLIPQGAPDYDCAVIT